MVFRQWQNFAGSKVQVTFHRSRVQVIAPSINYQTTQIPLNLIEHFVKRLGQETVLMLFIYLYRGDLYSDLWKSDLYFRPIGKICNNYGYGHQNMQIPWDLRTSELLGIGALGKY